MQRPFPLCLLHAIECPRDILTFKFLDYKYTQHASIDAVLGFRCAGEGDRDLPH